ncbi:MAG: hypothetical protein A2600_11995 [Candidatus Lambdaproteobacteria bacterium RIFOXYD1_FULL_56_27]|uniref:Ketosynthase family 3 (KS3) domain-containing protein n=1 Tax=Candidatus Lambdaproteobacteria bacterium RIFOXYD2_FULL_56_26 TaxID=1817773 RepID=A0A1F6GXF0_9PROT|nr:MAG: hypothetical protein A2426_08860 [Candidatus Lambdaproteobacteria bacterium RIFOXYC1_FULL_56_13]OGH02710.1 MAG: hypothetical protein A2557_11550 [Candidatus Lambdaproteobacteria bacterium RIFOXYD2_FULL_56_26]OGH07969.1 MAG: hypothetical protein A2600_11995 [Candidatus Lambdaproteobacteria bacterium RIFOXYD1_FULL_56_27]
MRSPVVVTGMGVVSPFGLGRNTFWENLIQGRSAIRPIEVFDAAAYKSSLGAEIPSGIRNNLSLRNQAGSPEEDATFYAYLAAEEALSDAGLGKSELENLGAQAGLMVGTLCSSSRNYEILGRKYFQGDLNGQTPVSVAPTLVAYQLAHLADRLGISGPASLSSTACASGTDALGFALDLIRLGRCELVLVGGGDIISEVIHAGFNSVFSITQDCLRPFDKNRSGFAIGEGAAFLVFESYRSAKARGANIYAEVAGYGSSNSASHLTATSKDGSGEARAIFRALADADCLKEQVDYVNAHGTATIHNDRSETLALQSVFEAHSPHLAVSSIKSMIGHCMGAAGALEAVATVLSIHQGVIPPTINFQEREDYCKLDLVTNDARKMQVRSALSNSFGFAGNNASILFTQPQ